MTADLKFIGQIETPYQTTDECPGNIREDGPICKIHLDEAYHDALLGLEEGQNILVLYWFENSKRDLIQQTPPWSDTPKGTFALRSPHRPNPIAAGELPIEKLEKGVITVRGLDCLNGTKLLDIKPSTRKK